MSKEQHDITDNSAGQESAPPPPETTPESITPSPASENAPDQAGQPADPRDLEIAALKDRLLRLQADFDNYRKRIARDREDQIRRASESLLKDLLPVVDHFELGLRSAQKHHVKHAIIDGLSSVLKQMEQVLHKAGVSAIDTRDKPFDPRLHECVAHIHSEEHAENMIIEETRRGYLLGAFVIRASQVIVSSGPCPAPGAIPDAAPATAAS